ncbi:hypothetical protein HPP92_013956 [Vanilla planifolia]|uniref:YDG domain-containing protein n=1 Tax=Vanilla planifolia TaxID=51239 RepID=A0A835QQ08_VANPL|nr:hypothetical protein HPP92_013956 [Vanilla planifolia]
MRRCDEAMIVEKIRGEQERLGVPRSEWVGGRAQEEEEEELADEKSEVHEDEHGRMEENGSSISPKGSEDESEDGQIAHGTGEPHKLVLSVEEIQDQLDQFTCVMQQKFLSDCFFSPLIGSSEMNGSRRRRRDLGSVETMSNTSIRMFECKTSLASTFKAAKGRKRPCAAVNGKSATVQDYELQSLAHSASKVTSLDLSVVKLGCVESCNGTKVGYCLRKTRARLASADEALVMSPKDNEAEILNGTGKVHSCLEAINIDVPYEKLPESNAYHELMVSARNPMADEPFPSAESSNRQRSSQMRASALFDSISKHPKDAMPNVDGDNTQLGRLKLKVSPIRKNRNRKELAVFETESTSENKESTNGDGSDIEDSSRKRVKWIRHMFQSIYDRLSCEVKLTRKNDSRRIRVDLMTLKHLKENNLELHFGSIPLGQVPGVEIGDEFHLRAELFMLGLHRQLQGGIDYFKHDGRLLARSIISSGSSRYSDKIGNSQVLIYSGSGTPEKDQKLEYGNLALKNSIDAQNPIVLFGF